MAVDMLSGASSSAPPSSPIGSAPLPSNHPVNNLDSTVKGFDIFHQVPIIGQIGKLLGLKDPYGDMKKQWAYDTSKMNYEANLKDWLTKNSGQYNYQMAKSWEENKYEYGKQGMIKAGINPLVASLGSSGFASSPSSGSVGSSSSSHGYNRDQHGAKDVLGATASIAIGLAKILTMV